MENVKITIDDRELAEPFEGDWEVRFIFEDYLIVTGVMAESGEQAVRFAELKLAESMTLESQRQNLEEIKAKLVGVYGGY